METKKSTQGKYPVKTMRLMPEDERIAKAIQKRLGMKFTDIVRASLRSLARELRVKVA